MIKERQWNDQRKAVEKCRRHPPRTRTLSVFAAASAASESALRLRLLHLLLGYTASLGCSDWARLGCVLSAVVGVAGEKHWLSLRFCRHRLTPLAPPRWRTFASFMPADLFFAMASRTSWDGVYFFISLSYRSLSSTAFFS